MANAPRLAVPRGQRLVRALRRRWVAVGATALIALPALVDLLSGIRTAPFHWIAADVFYYLTVARNVARTGRVTFDGEHAMNGYHPLWQACVSLLELLRERAHLGEIAPFLIVVTSLFAIAGAAWLLALTFLRARRGAPLLLLMAIGVYPLLVLPFWIKGLAIIEASRNEGWMLPVFGTPWSYMNGMESGFAILFFAASLYLATRPHAQSSPRAAAYVGASLAALTLSRLDHGILAAAMLAGFALSCVRARARSSAAAAAAAFGAVLLPYLLVNRVYFGAFMPTSGAAKTTFPHLNPEHVANIKALLEGRFLTSPSWLPVVCREVQIVLPAILALIYLGVRAIRWRRTTRLDWMLSSAAVGAVGLAFYNFAYATYGGQGYWYYPISTLLPTLFVASGRFPRLRWTRARRSVALAVAAALTLAFFFKFHRHATYNRDFVTFFTKTSKQVRAVYPEGLPKFVEVDDGAVSFALDSQGESLVFALDPEGYKARKEHRLAELSYARGFRHLASFAYPPHDSSPNGIQQWAAFSFDQSMAKYTVKREYASPDGLFVLVRFDER